MDQDRRGVLFPARLPEFHRLAAAPEVAHAVRWIWIPEWQLPEGAASRQEVLPFPACNLVVEGDGIELVGPSTRRSERVLTGSGWAVGALLLPAAALALTSGAPAELRDAAQPLADVELHRAIDAAMTDTHTSGDARRAQAARQLSGWIAERVPKPHPDSDAALANALGALLELPEITRVDQLAERLHASTRTLQRLADRAFGISLHAMIRRRRLQEAAATLRDRPDLSIAALSAQLGYTDQAHFSTDFKSVLGVTPTAFRASAASPPLT
ncbi:helix-turn-helix transcriptional regulator [Leucobacter japonicus]|uniref:helix-turn-helix transcriptional regulator n=1 Tax=Leucobacter japonicus TaxID=1461259 RepID=UPI0009496C4C|nr:helix-turn-helix transcriptional regulator [Leucobacter japonicus]